MSAIPKPKEGWFNLLYFASAKSFTSKDFDTFPAPLDLSALFLRLEEMYNGITEKILNSSLVTINLEYVDVAQPGDESAQVVTIKEGDEVAIIPPPITLIVAFCPQDGSKGSLSPFPPLLDSCALAFAPPAPMLARSHERHLTGSRSKSDFEILHQPGFFLPYALTHRTPQTASVTSSTRTSVDAMLTSDVRVVMVETWQPSGRVRISHRSAQCGHMFSSPAGARKGKRAELENVRK
ncbi:hypothetical protein ABKA04_006529 [Annulohypoxylon sp. FPYF3050]